MELLEHTLYINLEQRRDRREHAEAEFKKLGVHAERVNAVKLEACSVGCTLSHIKCIKLAKERKYEQVFICEDDITFTNPELFKEQLTKFYENDDILWDILIIGGNNIPPFQKVESYCARIFNCQTTTGYIIKESYYDTLLANFKESADNLIKYPERKREFAIDIYWKRLQIQDFWYMLMPSTVTQYESYSDIEKRYVNYEFLLLDMEKEWYADYVKRQNELLQSIIANGNMDFDADKLRELREKLYTNQSK